MKKGKVLEALGFRKDWIYETIIATYSGAKAHSAPMGVSTHDHVRLTAEIYKSSETCANILSKKAFSVNLSSDVSLFYDSYCRKEALVYGRADNIDAPILAQADACLEISVEESIDLGDKMRFIGKVVGRSARKEYADIKPINRADALAIEALIAFSKIPSAQAEEKDALVKEIRRICRVVSRVAPGSDAERLVNVVSLRL
ncbi:MAG: DUF447 domain-containing protein [Candidatus Altiarchaeia archaeon]